MTILTVGQEIQAMLLAVGVRLAEIDARLKRVEQAVSECPPTPDQSQIDALTVQVQQATAGLTQSTAGLEAAITQESKTP